MNNAELFARGNLINRTIKINSLCAEVKERRNKHCDTLLSSPPLFDFTSKMQRPTVALFTPSSVNMQH